MSRHVRVFSSRDEFLVHLALHSKKPRGQRQLRHVRRSLDIESAATLVHAFVTSRVDYCNTVLAGTPKSTTDRLQKVLNAEAVLLAKLASSITVCRSCYMTSFTGSTYRSGSTSSCVQLFIGASSARHHHIWLTFASQYPTLPAGSTYDLPTATNYMYSVVVARCSAIGPSLLPALRPGTHFQTTFETWHCHHILSE